MDQLTGSGPERAMRDSMEYWSRFVDKCIFTRLDTERFEEFIPLVQDQHPLPPFVIALLFLRPQPYNVVSLDPRIPPYIQILTKLGYVDAPSILRVLYKFSSLHTQFKTSQNETQSAIKGNNPDQGSKEKSKNPRRWNSSAWVEEFMFYHVIKIIVEGTAFRDSRVVLELVQVISKWMELFTSVSSVFATDVMGELQSSQARIDMETARAAFVPLLLRLVEVPALVKAISSPHAKAIRKSLANSMAGFIQTLQPAPGFVERLEIFRTETLARLDPIDKKDQAATNAAMDELLGTTVGLDSFVIPDLLISNTRSAVYVFLNASLVGRSLIDDNVLISYLQNRYQGATQSSAIELIVASFDILANAVFRNEGPKDAHLLKSFLVNKIPLLLCLLFLREPTFDTNASEFCITEALSQVDTSVFPTASLMFDESRSNNPYTESVREEFCTACALHGLVQREHVERILGELSMSYEPSLEKYSKENLIQDCLADAEKVQGLIRELEKMDGNVGAVCQALVEVMRQLCNNKETMSLKLLCSQLAQKPQILDILLLFEKLPSILDPLCQLLDNWRYEEDQGEYQPIYEEFGSILLLVLAFAYRYNLTAADIGITSPDSCIAKILGRAHISRDGDELTEQEKGHLSGWIHGLFADSGGLGDDLMSSCPPHGFYLLVASLFQNIVVAYTYGYLSDETLKGGIEYLVDTFLLPSLVPALRFLADYLWVEQKEQKAIIKILQLILLPSSISGEASTMLSSVRNLVAKPLEHSLRTYQRQDPKNQDIQPLLRALKDSLPLSRRTGGADHNELESWTNSSSTGLAGALRHTVQGLVQWSMHPSVNSMPTSYTHRQLIAAQKIMGAKRTLRLLLEEVRTQSETGSANIVYDAVAAIVCAPNVTNEPPPNNQMMDASGNVPPAVQRPLTLREVLRLEAEGCNKLQKADPVLAEIVVRLYRRVEAHMAMPQNQAILEAPGIQLDLGSGAGGLGDVDAMAAAVGVSVDGMTVDGLDMGIGGPGSAGGLDATSDGDLFGGLDTNGMDMFGWGDSMDLSGN
ncbi:Mediator of RNA polymerase II transcription subunit 5, partial [Metarhizium majus ARSEF 297]